MITCAKCGERFETRIRLGGKVRNLKNRKYCLSCSPFGQHNTSKIHKRSDPRPCLQCGKKLNKGRRFCGHKCAGAAKAKAQFERLDAVSAFDGEYEGAVRRYLINKFGAKCQICEREKWGDRVIPVVMDHIDGNSTNWDRSNLRLICPNCDALLPTYKARNRGNGRHSRRERYRQGKSY